MAPALWTECEACEDYICNLHDQHAFDCPCPAVEDFIGLGIDPYSTPTDDPRLARVRGEAPRPAGDHPEEDRCSTC